MDNSDHNFVIHVECDRRVVRVSGPNPDFVQSHFSALEERFLNPLQRAPQIQDQSRSSSGSKRTSLQEFVRAVAPKSGTEYATTIGYYLENHTEADSFTSADIREGFVAVKFNIKNPSDAISKAKAAGKLMENADKSGFVVTQSGEDWIQSRLPA